MGFEFGIFDSFDLARNTPGEQLAIRLRLAEHAERLGIQHYHVTEHHGTSLSVCPSPNLFLTALARQTTMMRMGAMVYVLPMYEPLRLAEEIAVIDQLSGGRLDIGVGSGVSPYELGYFGVPVEQARAVFDGRLPALAKAWETGVLHHPEDPGREPATLSILPVQRPHPPIWYASSNQRSAGWAGAQSVNFIGRWNGGEFVPAVEAYWEAWRSSADDADRLNPHVTSPLVGPNTSIVIGDSEQQALDLFMRAGTFFWERVVKLPHDHDDHRIDAMLHPQAMLERGTAIVGTADSVLDQFVAQMDEAEINYLEAGLYFGDMTFDESFASLQRFSELMPKIRSHAARSKASTGAA